MPIKKSKEKSSADHWYSLSVADCFKKLKSSKNGLSDKQAKTQQKLFGLNVLPQEKPLSSFLILLNQLLKIFLKLRLLKFMMFG